MSCFLYDSYKEFSDYSILLYVSPLYSLSPWGGGFQVARKNKLGKITMQYLSPNLYPILSPLPSATPLPPIDQSTFVSALPRQH